MLKKEAINYFGSRTKVAQAAGVHPSAVSQWGELIPEKNAFRLELASDHKLKYDPEIYDSYAKAKLERGSET
ncbi:Cro/CI family transcriptional regulator [Shimwellia blattae]|uniref:Cro/CI family transcriptional regulator n=1 Tax=Shimwellia blattae TaxID=563 RepID=UPI000290DEB5|nr:Cro/CI family transcriptional regulator [Shimwellia blattae]GAB82291.1 prophage Qin transcriptional repressor DicC [Shimwellia blattae DSM 4481 = NBRC 105725]